MGDRKEEEGKKEKEEEGKQKGKYHSLIQGLKKGENYYLLNWGSFVFL
jgi:hypothetical protein